MLVALTATAITGMAFRGPEGAISQWAAPNRPVLDSPAGGNIAQHSGAGRAGARHRHHRRRCSGLCGAAAPGNQGSVQVGPAARRLFHRSAARGPASVGSLPCCRITGWPIATSPQATLQSFTSVERIRASNVRIRGCSQTSTLSHLSLLSRECSEAVKHAAQSMAKGVVGCRGLFATHYHMLSEEHAVDPAVALHHMGCHVQHSADGEHSARSPVLHAHIPWSRS